MEDINDDGGDSTTMTKRENGRQDSRTRVCHANSTTKEQSHSFALGKNVPNKRHIDQLELSDEVRNQVFEENARKVYPRLDRILKERGL